MTPWIKTCLLAALLCLAGCAEPDKELLYQDYPVEFDGDPEAMLEPGLVAGLYVEPNFIPLGDGDQMPIINGFQGGTWIHLSIQATGIEPQGLVRASLGEVSSVRYGLKLTRTATGTLESYDIPLPIQLSEEEIEALFGQELPLSVEFQAGSDKVMTELMVVVSDGR